MASRDTNGTIFTVALVAIGAFIAWKIFGGRKSQQASSQYPGVGGGAYYPPDYPNAQQGGGLGQALKNLAAQLGIGGGGGGGGKNPGLAGSGSQDYSALNTLIAAKGPFDASNPLDYGPGSSNLDYY